MSFASLMDHRAIVYRATETRDELQDVIQSWGALTAPGGKNCRPNQVWSGNQQDYGPGEQQGATQQWYLLPGFEVAERDVLSVVSGPKAPVLLRVLSVSPCTAPIALHHYEVIVEVWKGSLTEEPVTS